MGKSPFGAVNSLKQKALNTAVYVLNTETGKKEKRYMVPIKKKQATSVGNVTGSVSDDMAQRNIGFVQVKKQA